MAHELSTTVGRDGQFFIESTVEPGKVLEGPFATEAIATSNAQRRSANPNIRVDQALLARKTDPQLRPPLVPTTLFEQLGAAFGLENTVASLLAREAEGPAPTDIDGYIPNDHLLPGEAVIAERFVDANSDEEMNLIRARIKREQLLRRQLADGPLNEMFAILLAVIPDPTTFFGPGAAALRGGLLVGKGGRAFALGAAADIAASETILQKTQETRTATETLANIVLGGAFGGTIGAVLSAKAKAHKAAVRDFVELFDAANGEGKVLSQGQEVGTVTLGGIEATVEGGAAGAQRVQNEFFTPANTKLVGTGGVARFLAKLSKVGLAAPGLELMASPFPKARELVMRLVDTGLTTVGMTKFLSGPPSVDLKIRGYTAMTASAAKYVKHQFKEYRRGGGTLKKRDFYKQVSRSIRRHDTHTIPEVAEAAKNFRAHIFEPLKKEAITLKLLDADVKVEGGLSYFMRVYDSEKILANRATFKNIIIEGLQAENPKADPLDTREIADLVIDRILGVPQNRLPTGIKIPQGKRGPLKERTLNIPDDFITSRGEAFEDFLVDDVLEVAARYVRSLGADIEVVRAFGPVDPKSGIGGLFETKLGEFREEAQKIIDAAPQAKQSGLAKQLEREEKLLESLMEKVRGVLSRPADPRMRGAIRIAKGLRNLNFLGKLGSVLLSSIPDIGLIVMSEGLTRTFGTFFSEMARGFKGIRLNRIESKKAGTVLEMEMSTRMQAVFDVGEKYAAESKFERGVDAASNVFSYLNLLNPWNDAMKSVTSALVSTRILKVVQAVADTGRVSVRDGTKLAKAGINPDMARRIAKQREHFEQSGPVTIANTDAWADAGARDAFRHALLRDVDNVIITPGSGDAPLWTTTEWGKSVFQFKRFAAASTQRVLLAGLQARDIQTMNGLMLIVGLGAFGTMMRDITRTGEVKDRSPRQWVAEGVDRSGAVAMFVELDAIAGEATGLSIMRTFAGGQDVSRLQGRELVERLGGPTASLVSDLAAATTGALRGDFTQGDLHRGRRLMPAQNLFTMTYLIDKIEKAMGEGLPSKQGATRRMPRQLPLR